MDSRRAFAHVLKIKDLEIILGYSGRSRLITRVLKGLFSVEVRVRERCKYRRMLERCRVMPLKTEEGIIEPRNAYGL